MDRQSQPIGDTSRPPFLTLKRALEETFWELCRHARQKRESGTPLLAMQALDDARRSFSIVFRANKHCFPEAQHAELDALDQQISASIAAVETLVGVANLWLSSMKNNAQLALDYVKLGIDAILVDAQKKFM